MEYVPDTLREVNSELTPEEKLEVAGREDGGAGVDGGLVWGSGGGESPPVWGEWLACGGWLRDTRKGRICSQKCG